MFGVKKMCRRDFLWIAFGAGLVIACCCPTIWVTRILAIAVIVLDRPKVLAPLLRVVFKIKKVKPET